MKKIIAILSISAIVLTSCGGDKKEQITKEAAIAVKVSGVSENTEGGFITASGKIEAENSANLSTRMMGYVTKLHVKVGQKVGAGQLLVSINNSDLASQESPSRCQYSASNCRLQQCQKRLRSFREFIQTTIGFPKELDDMTARYEMAKAGLEGAKQMRNEVISQFSYSNITAPFSGTVTNTFVKEGDMANRECLW